MIRKKSHVVDAENVAPGIGIIKLKLLIKLADNLYPRLASLISGQGGEFTLWLLAFECLES